MPTKKYLHNIDLAQNQLQNAVVENRTSAPSGAVDGQLYYNTTDKKLYSFNASGSTWGTIASQYIETDPVFVASAAFNVTTVKISNWDAAFGWGNHSSAGYLTTALAASTYQPLDGDLTAIAALAGTSGFLKKTAANTWTLDTNTYLTSFTETDPIFTASAAFGITSTNISNWNTAYGWGNHASAGYQVTSQKGQPNGYASLDGGGKVPVSQLPSSIMEYKGTWNASTNSPTLANGTGDTGDVYRVSVAGTQNLGSGNITFDIGDYVIYNGTIWEKSDTTDAVASVNGLTGIVVLSTSNISEGTSLYYTDTRARGAISLTTTGTSGAATYNSSTGVLNIPQYQAVLTNPVTGTGTSGQIAYFNGTTTLTSKSTFVWDATNDRLGIGITPQYKLDISGSDALNGSMRLMTASSNNRLEIWTTNANAASRNWAIAANSVAFGDFAIRQSDAKDGQPSTGTVRLYFSAAGNVLLGSTTDVTSSLFTLASTTKGFLPPRMTSAERTAIGSPAVGLVVYQTDGTEGLYENTSGGWRILFQTATGNGTVTSVSVVSANGISGTVATASTTPAITLTLGAITPTSVNSVVISGSSTPTLAVTGTSSISGSNTGDNAVNSLYSSLVSNATHTGDATGATALTVVGLRGVALPTLGASAGFLRYTGTGTNTWVFDTATYLTANQSITLSGDVSGTGTTAITTTIGANRVTNAMLAQIPTATFHGRVTAATGNVENITGTQATTLLDVFTSTLKGLAPASGGGTTNFLRADGTWAAPSGTGGGTVNSVSVVSANGFAGTVATSTTTPAITLTTTITGILKGNGTAISAAVAGTDYQGASTNLTSLAGLTFASTSFVKMTAAGTFALDTNTYYLASNPSGYTTNTGTVTSISVVPANGISASIATSTTTPAITLALGAITPASVNSVVISGSATPTLAVTGTSSISGSNTGDNAVNSLYSGLVSNATHTGDATGATALTVVGLRGVALPTLGASAGFLRYTGTGTNTWVFDTATYLTANQTITLSGAVTGSGTTTITTTLANSVVGIANLSATGTPSSTTYLRGDNTWATIAGGGITTLNTLTGATQTFATGTAGTDFTITSTGTTHTFDIPDAGASARGLVNTTAQSFSGTKTGNWAGNFTTGAGSFVSNFYASSQSTTVSSSTGGKIFGGNSTITFAVGGGGAGTAQLTANTGFSFWNIGSVAATTAASGTHTSVSTLVVKAAALNAGTAGVTNFATLYIDGAATGTATITNNYAVWIDDGAVRIDTLGGSGTRMVVADALGVLSTQAIPGGGSAYSVTSVSTTYSETATSGTKIIKATTAGGTFAITLPTAVGNTATIIIKKTAGTAVLTIDGDGTETIDGGLTASMNKVDESITLVSDNSNWLII